MVGVMGSGSEPHRELALPLGAWLARRGVHLLTGGGGGVMASVSEGFAGVGGRRGLVIGVLPGEAGAPAPLRAIRIRGSRSRSGPIFRRGERREREPSRATTSMCLRRTSSSSCRAGPARRARRASPCATAGRSSRTPRTRAASGRSATGSPFGGTSGAWPSSWTGPWPGFRRPRGEVRSRSTGSPAADPSPARSPGQSGRLKT